MSLKHVFQQSVTTMADLRDALPCPVPEEWHADALGLHPFSQQQQDHVATCERCKRTKARWQWAFRHPRLRDLLRWRGGHLEELERFALELHVGERGCEHCRALVSSAWFRCLLTSIEQGRHTVEELLHFVDRVQPLLDAISGTPRGVPMTLAGSSAFSSGAADVDAMTCLGDDRLSVVVPTRNGKHVLSFEHPDPPHPSILKVSLVGTGESRSWSRYVVLYPWRSDSRAAVGELLLDFIDSASPPLIVAAFLRVDDVPDSSADELLVSAVSARENDPAALPYWKEFCDELIASRQEIDPKLLECLETIANLDPCKPTAVFAGVTESTVVSLSAWEKLGLLSRVEAKREQYREAFESLRELECPRELCTDDYRTDGYELDLACQDAVRDHDDQRLLRAWKQLQSAPVSSGLCHYFSSDQFYKKSCVTPVEHDKIVRGLQVPIAGALALLAREARRTKDVHSWVAEMLSAGTGRNVDPADVAAAANTGAEAAGDFDRYLKSLAQRWKVGLTRDVVSGLVGKERTAIRSLSIALPGIRGQSGFQCCFHLDLLGDGTGEFYADPATMRLYPTCADFSHAMELAWRAANIPELRRKSFDVRWSINAELPALSGDSLGGLVALGIIQLFDGASGNASWTMSAALGDETGRLVRVDQVGEKVRAVIDRNPKLTYVFVQRGDASEARRAARERMAPRCVRAVETLADAVALIRRSNRRKRYLLAALAAALLVVGAFGIPAIRSDLPAVIIPGHDLEADIRERYLPVRGSQRVEAAAATRAVPAVAQGPPSLSSPVILDATRPSGLRSGIDYGVFYNDERLPDTQFAYMWRERQSPPYWNLYYNVKEHDSYVGLWLMLGSADWSRYVDGELVIRCRRIGPLPETPIVFEAADAEVTQTDCAPRIKLEVKLNKLDAGGEEYLKSERYVDLPEAARSRFVDVRVPLADFRRVIGFLNGYNGETLGVREVAVVFENRKLRDLDSAPLTSNFGVQAIVLTESPGQDVDQLLSLHAGRTECLVDVIATPSGFMGDLGEAAVESDGGRQLDGIRAMAGSEGGTRFVYIATGKGPHEWDLKYERNGRLNTSSANFGACGYLNPSNNWGDRPGTDLRDLQPTRILWEARKLSQHDCNVEFFIGSDGFVWEELDNTQGRKITPPYPESLPRLGLRNQVMTSTGPRVAALSHEWQTFYEDLSFLQNDPRLNNVICLFGWVIRDPHADYKEYEFEVRNIRFVRE